MTDVCKSVNIPVPHVIQQTQWDCGLACAQMALRHHLQDSYSVEQFTAICQDLDFNESVWTIDIAHIMTKYNIKHHLYTQTLGVDSRYKKQDFYEDTFDEDEKRVNNLFSNAEHLGIKAIKRSVTLREIHQHLSENHIAIVLVNSDLLKCKICREELELNQEGSSWHWMFSCCTSTSYAGHFIVVCGYDKTEKTIFYKNPSSYSELCICSSKDFDKARKSYGTDEDILFLYSK
ncbi:protein GUCD1-like [Saccoglossus kowalevskii]|uniref:Protein GUCD1-like n=1 Tax=Saccoglossus kowalevskii TaxID=10224 RepID=A0ABM0MJ05_SACKO|nr:PREDICTED: protein GUCD1-like [Saccoglossus kowalevskii]